MSSSSRRLAAVLFDLDGTLIDSEPAWFASERRLVELYGGTWTDEDALAQVGNPLLVSAENLRAAGVDLPADQIVELMLDDVVRSIRGELRWRPGAAELLTELSSAGVPCALVTMSYRRLAEAVVAALPPDTFAALVVGDEVSHGKPHPEPYLRAVDALAAPASRCVVIEDSVLGVTSGEAAGCVVLAVPHKVPIAPGPGRTIVDSLTDVDLATLETLISRSERTRHTSSSGVVGEGRSSAPGTPAPDLGSATPGCRP